ncbi:inward rectifier potassium channel 16-like [Gouania willdenowi]|uniref:inward rectifier potassium channel 16-like n=1 Tax=Gouania willdenowi TaxID=441366 RepID=UPI001056C70A|nr:inward rectifier potassium channel 16-like [Gouania willdenowi]XP_028311081.1 inward rectifier potassium channel 16-like [Gouania willdenowi]XP_028311082.1 inward rectifier potassium channel 16-like [Gouania willdenowi]XP_028311083.1 inward rectifier potassium channel 16-like [Gouania willdenowi]XP_028311084.1 inward rectifier potassium channel 16-like [Gouania willdenowi]XP_028311085.1 inward rectifier potassium channel 16-like [Gouania willdenowi]XP_028311086.1 inward rectifier potassium
MRMETTEQVIDTSYTTVHTLVSHNKEARRLRYMQKDGRFPVSFQKSPGDWNTYFIDIFTTLVEIRWRVMFLVFSLSYILSWLFFGLSYWLIAHVHGDTVHLDNNPCVENVRGFTAAFLFSMETQATIGYGFRGMTENCMVAIVVVTFQDVLSCLLDTIIIGIIVAKMASARKRAQTVGFSSCAVVNLRDGVLCLSWRLGDFRGNHILDGVARAQLVRYVKKPLGSVVLSYQDLEIENRDIVIATPATIIHKLEHRSPLYCLGPEDLLEEDFELVVSFTYTGDSTGMLHQTRTCYTAADIRWGQRFQDMIKVGKKHYKVDYARFNETTWVPVPSLSAEEYDRRGGSTEDSHVSPSVKTNGHMCQLNLSVTKEVMQQTVL